MFSKILIKLIDQAIVPAALLLSLRIASVVFFSRYFGVDFTFGGSGFMFNDQAGYIAVNSYSILTMIFVLTLGLFYILIKSYVFHETHVSPGTTTKVFSLRASALIQSSFDVYSQGAVWLSYTFLLTFVAGVMVLFGLLLSWVFYVALILSVLSTVLFIIDIEQEFHISKTRGSETDWDNLEEVEEIHA